MAESIETFSEIASIRDELEEQGNLIEALLRAQPQLREETLTKILDDSILGEILLLVDGKRSQNEIGELLRARRVKGASVGNLSNKFDKLAKDLHLIRLADRRASGKIYTRSRLEKVLGVVRSLERLAKQKR
ncbi:MAG: hypothetical protein JWN67_1690 [Actinomycetia bacterium]|nr:hypothetical protein [Actinomycetes bacterium]